MHFQAVCVILVSISLIKVEAFFNNSFDVIRGCKQYNGVVGYDEPLTYFPTSNFHNVGRTSNSRYFKIAVVAANDGIFRLGETFFPYDRNVIEIVLGGWANTQSAGRRQFRTASNRNTITQLTIAKTPNLLSRFRPVMFVLEVFNDGLIEVRLDGQGGPLLSFRDTNRTPANYIGFTKWNVDTIFFYDCPLLSDRTVYKSVPLNSTVG
uniref:Methyltransf_FA domain-containing protein n=1 Tax=Anopheles dirus TaxID=7168 RepID=A0A182NXV1_9DIPT